MTLIINGKTYEANELIAYVVNLEKEYAELKKTYRKQRNKRIDELQKENTKLKTDYAVLSCSIDDFGELQNRLEEEQRKNNGLSDDLAKAKELIVTFLGLIQTFGYSPSMDKFMTEARQFVNSEVEK